MRSVQHVETSIGRIAYEERGEGRPALLVHGVFLNGHYWRHVTGGIADQRRCIAIDLLGHGDTQAAGDDVDFGAQADMLEAVCEALRLDQVDLIANDSGGGIAQIFAACHPERIRSLTLTNCDTHDNFPPPALEPLMGAVRAGRLPDLVRGMATDIALARRTLALGYADPERLSPATVATYLEPFLRTERAMALLARFFEQLDPAENVAAEPGLKALRAPTLIVWGDADPFFPVEWAHWLARTIPGARPPIVVPGAKLFFPEERPEELVRPLREFLAKAPSALSAT